MIETTDHWPLFFCIRIHIQVFIFPFRLRPTNWTCHVEHEHLVEEIAQEIGFKQVSLSSKLSSTIKVVPRGTSTTCDAYLTPVLMEYIEGFFQGFDESLRNDVQKIGEGGNQDKYTQVEFMFVFFFPMKSSVTKL